MAGALARLGRTEDVNFSPDGKRLAIAGYGMSQILVLDVELEKSGSSRAIKATDYIEISSADLKLPHGVFWVNDQTLIAANRRGAICVFSLPQREANVREISLEPVAKISTANFRKLHSPGSVSVFQRSRDEYEVLVCNNYAHRISRHSLSFGNEYRFLDHNIYFSDGLKIPDGIAHSPTGKLIAVSNHSRQRVDIFDGGKGLDETSQSAAKLEGVRCPHGVRFSKDGNLLAVADAAEPFVHVFQKGAVGWRDTAQPVASIRVLDEETFVRGHVNPEEGGPKGLDFWGDSGVLVVTCEEVPLAFFDISPILHAKGELPSPMKRRRLRPEPSLLAKIQEKVSMKVRSHLGF